MSPRKGLHRKLLILHGLLVSVRQEHYVNRKAIMLITGDLPDLSTDLQRAEISSGTHTPNSPLYSLSGYCIGSLACSTTELERNCTRTDVF